MPPGAVAVSVAMVPEQMVAGATVGATGSGFTVTVTAVLALEQRLALVSCT